MFLAHSHTEEIGIQEVATTLEISVHEECLFIFIECVSEQVFRIGAGFVAIIAPRHVYALSVVQCQGSFVIPYGGC